MDTDKPTEVPWPIYKAGGPGTRQSTPASCFYCKASDGQPHERRCVIVNKKILVKYEFTLGIAVPYGWAPEMVEFCRNDGAWCADNAIEEILATVEDDGCLCSIFNCTYISCVDPTPFEND